MPTVTVRRLTPIPPPFEVTVILSVDEAIAVAGALQGSKNEDSQLYNPLTTALGIAGVKYLDSPTFRRAAGWAE
jgi:hypothetical protein